MYTHVYRLKVPIIIPIKTYPFIKDFYAFFYFRPSFNQPRNPFTSNLQQSNRNVVSNNVAQRNPFLTTTLNQPLRPTQNRVSGFSSGSSRPSGRPLQSTNIRSNSGTSGAQFPPLPLSPFRPRTPARTPSVNTIGSSANNNLNRNNNRLSFNNNNNGLNFNNPFLSRPSSQGRPLPTNNLRPIPPLPSITSNQQTFPTTTPRPVQASRITTPRPVFTSRRTTPRPLVPTTPRRTPRPFPTTTPRPARPTSAPRLNLNTNSQFNHFQTAARLNNAINSSGKKPSNNPFIRRGQTNSIRSGDSKLGSIGGFSRTKSPKKNTLPPVVPMGFEWPGGNGYFFRMSTGNSKPIQYFISYDD